MGLMIELENRSVVAPSAKADHCTPVSPSENTAVLRHCRKTCSCIARIWLYQILAMQLQCLA